MIGNRKEIIDWLLNQSEETIFEIKEYKKKRSLNANGYLWILIQQMAGILKTDKISLYQKYIKEKGIFRTMTVKNDAVGTITYLWQNNGLGWIYDITRTGEDETDMILYYGTSSYNTHQMAQFIDYVVADAKTLGIETLTPSELERLKEDWK